MPWGLDASARRVLLADDFCKHQHDHASNATSTDDEITNGEWPTVVASLYLNGVFCVGLLALFEVFRTRKRRLYARRAQKAKHRTPAPEPAGLLGWVRPTQQLRGERTLALVGMDAYMMLRFCRVCTRMCLFASCLGAACLMPLYASGRQGLPDFYRYTMANIQRTCSPGSDGEGCVDPADAGAVHRLWASVALAYVFAAHACYLLNHEWKHFTARRSEFLLEGDADVPPAAARTVLVERIPRALRSDAALHSCFDHLFPGRVVGATVYIELGALDALVAARDAPALSASL